MKSKVSKPLPATGIFLALMCLFGVGLLLLLPTATDLGPPGQGWWAQPRLMPLLSLVLVTVPAIYLFAKHIRLVSKDRTQSHERSEVLAELFQWVRPLEFFIYYIAYIYLLGLVGYFLSSLIFIVVLGARVGLRSWRWIFIGFLCAFMLIVLFRWGLGVWVPTADLYELFPKDIRIFLTRYF